MKSFYTENGLLTGLIIKQGLLLMQGHRHIWFGWPAKHSHTCTWLLSTIVSNTNFWCKKHFYIKNLTTLCKLTFVHAHTTAHNLAPSTWPTLEQIHNCVARIIHILVQFPPPVSICLSTFTHTTRMHKYSFQFMYFHTHIHTKLHPIWHKEMKPQSNGSWKIFLPAKEKLSCSLTVKHWLLIICFPNTWFKTMVACEAPHPKTQGTCWIKESAVHC